MTLYVLNLKILIDGLVNRMSKKDPFGLSKLNILQDIISNLLNLFPYTLEHNSGKYMAIRKAHYLACIDGIEGDYLEFGVFTGSSFTHSMRAYAKTKRYDTRKRQVSFYGFDSFEGFGEVEEKYAHKFFQDSNFKWPYQKVVDRVNKLSKKLKLDAKIKKGFYKDTLDNPTNYGIEKASIIFLDSDLYTATLESLNFCTSLIQNGTIILIDEFFYFKGMKENTPYGAFIEWCKKNSFEFRVITHYGIGSAIVSMSK